MTKYKSTLVRQKKQRRKVATYLITTRFKQILSLTLDIIYLIGRWPNYPFSERTHEFEKKKKLFKFLSYL